MRSHVLWVWMACMACSNAHDQSAAGMSAAGAAGAMPTSASGAAGVPSGAGASGPAGEAASGGAGSQAGSAGDQTQSDAALPDAALPEDGCEDQIFGTLQVATVGFGVHSVLLELGMLRGVQLHFLVGEGPTAFEHALGTVEIIVHQAAIVTEHATRTATGCERELQVHAEVRVTSEDGRLNESIPTELSLHSSTEIELSLTVARADLVGTLRDDPALANIDSLVLEATYAADTAAGTLRVQGTSGMGMPDTLIAEWTGGRGNCRRPDQLYAAPDATDCGELFFTDAETVRSCVSNAVLAAEPFSASVVVSGKGTLRTTIQSLPPELTAGGRAAFMEVRANEFPPSASMRRCLGVSTLGACMSGDWQSCFVCTFPGPSIPLCLQNGNRTDSRDFNFEM